MGKYVKGYDLCQKIKNKTKVLVGKLKLSKISEKLWMYLMVDFITKSPLVTGKDAFLVVYNRLSKLTYFVTTTGETLAEGLAQLFRDNMWKLYRLLVCVVSNRELQFAIELTKELNKMLGVKIKLLTSFHLQTDRQMEQMNQELEQYLQFFIDHRQKDWLEWLVLVEFVVNNKTHLVTKISLFMANYERES